MRYVMGAAAAAGLLLSLAASAETVGEDAGACQAGQGPSILADIQGLKDRRGEIRLELYPATQQDFLRADFELIQAGKVFRRVRAPAPATGPVSMCLKVPGPGRYAIVFTHNRAGKDKFNIWRDGAGVVRAGVMGYSQPKVEFATVDVGQDMLHVAIKVQYMRGIRGFAPLD